MDSEQTHLRYTTLHNFDEFPWWSFKFLWALAEEDLKNLIEGTEDSKLLTTAERKLIPKSSQRAMAILIRCLGEHDHLIGGVSTAQQAWAMPIEHSKSRDSKRGANLQEWLWSMKYQPGMSGGMLEVSAWYVRWDAWPYYKDSDPGIQNEKR